MKELCDELELERWIQSRKVRTAMMQVDRADFASTNPYQNFPQPIPCNVVISAPLLHAYCLEALKDHLTEGSTVLDVGFGSGYLTVAMSKMMNDKGCVVGIEHIKNLYEWGMGNISKNHKNLLDEKKIELVLGDGRLGYKNKAPYKCIHVGAGARKVPEDILKQLDCGGRLVMPLGHPDDQYIYFIDKDLNGNVKYTKGLSVCYVLLTSVKNQLNNIE
jgi:protein-L-isoaspartate(D-aspartate) O-methyltransferase